MPGHLRQIQNYYSDRVHPRLKGFQILSWSSWEAQHGRFQVLLEVLKERLSMDSCPSLLDVGCGLAELSHYLPAQGFPVDYLGVDVTEKILSEARRRSPATRLECQDIFQAQSPYPVAAFEVVYCSGIFNLELGNNDEFARRGLVRLAELSSRVTVANFLHQRTRRKFRECHYFDPDWLLSGLCQAGITATLREDYMENDFSIICEKICPAEAAPDQDRGP